MGRTIDSVCKLCRREGIKLYLKGHRCDSPKCAIERRNTPPGMHVRRGKPSEYGIRLREKQKPLDLIFGQSSERRIRLRGILHTWAQQSTLLDWRADQYTSPLRRSRSA